MVAESLTFCDGSPPVRPYRRSSTGPTWIGALAVAGVLLSLALSDNALVTLGIPYTLPYGNPLAKIHPGSYLILLAVMLATLIVNPFRFLWHSLRNAPTGTVYTAIMLLAIAFGLRFGTAGTAFMVQTLLIPGLLAVLLAHMPAELAARGYRLILGLVAVNAVLGIGEAALGERLVPYMVGDVPIIEDHFRATALFGHPLNNAELTACALLTTLVLDRPVWVRLSLCLLYAVGLLAFGGRTALAVTAGFSLLLGLSWLLRMIRHRRLKPHHFVVLTGLAVLVPALAAVAFTWLGLGLRIVESLYWDESAGSRIYALQILDRFSWDELLLGVSAESITRATDYLAQYTPALIVENFWLLLFLQFGAFIFVLFVIAFAGLLIGMGQAAPAPVSAMLVAFLIITSTSNSLGVKNVSLTAVVLLAVGATAEHRRRMYRLSRTSQPAARKQQ